jgi:hypothetical protein
MGRHGGVQVAHSSAPQLRTSLCLRTPPRAGLTRGAEALACAGCPCVPREDPQPEVVLMRWAALCCCSMCGAGSTAAAAANPAALLGARRLRCTAVHADETAGVRKSVRGGRSSRQP